MFRLQFHIKQGFAIAETGVVDNRFKKLPVFFKFRHPLITETKALTICPKTMMLKFVVQFIQNLFTIINRLVNGVTKVGNKRIIEAQPQRFQFGMTLSENMVFVAIV